MDRYAYKNDICYYAKLDEFPRHPPGPLQLYSFGCFPHKTHVLDRSLAGHVVVQVITEGDGFVEIDGKRQVAEVPFVVLSLPQFRYRYGPVTSWAEAYLLYAVEGNAFLDHWGLPSTTPLVWPLRNLSEVRSIISTMQRICSKPNLHTSVDILDRFGETLFLLSRHGFDGGTMSREEERILDAESYVRANTSQDLSVEELAERFGFSRTGFYRHWNALFATSPNELIIDLRLENARRRLTETTDSLKEVAREAGFNSTVHFARMFQKKFRTSPAEFRKSGG